MGKRISIEEKRRRKRIKFIDSLAHRIWAWEQCRGIRCTYGPVFATAAARCLFATKGDQDNLTWHNRTFRFYTSEKYLEYEQKESDEEILELILKS